jgi:hypothetical protein
MALSPNFGFPEPNNSSLVKNGAQDIRALGDSIDTFLAGGVGFAAGKNKIINGDFRINQRAFTSTTNNSQYGFDRWRLITNQTVTYSAETFTVGAAPVAGYEGINFARMATTAGVGAGDYAILSQPIEDVRILSGQTVTVSFWAKAASGTPKLGVELFQNFGSGGSTATGAAGQSVTLNTSWTRYSVTIANPSVAGKTIGTSSFTEFNLWASAGSTFNTRSGSVGNQTATIDVWGVQVETGATATPFQIATGTIQGELAACQRYYQRFTGNTFTNFGIANAPSTTAGSTSVPLLTQMRITPTAIDYGGGIRLTDQVANFTVTAITIIGIESSPQRLQVTATSSSLTQFRMYFLSASSDAAAFLGVSAEL